MVTLPHSSSELAQALVSILEQAVERAIGEKTGAVLSGGIDSSSVVGTARKLGHDLPCFTGYYEAEEFDERRWANLAAGTEHQEILITPQDFVENFDACAKAVKEPFQGMGTFGQYMVAKYVAAQGIKTVLSGEGADELFGGYARLMIVAGDTVPDGYQDYQLPPGYPRNIKDALQWDLDRLPDLLAVDDQMCSAHGLEAKAPFTDPEMMDFATSLDPIYRLNKRLLKLAMDGIVPDAILTRTDKKGFPAPYVDWAQRDPVRSFVLNRIDYLPDLSKPWERGWFHDLIKTSAPTPVEVAA